MAFREYWHIIQRRWWVILLLPLLTGLFTLLTSRNPVITYGATLKYSVSFLPAPRESMEQDPRLGAVMASEYVADDLTQVLRGSRFIGFVRQNLPPEQVLSAAQIGNVTKEHRVITVPLSAGTEEEAVRLSEAVRQATEEDLEPLLNELWGMGDLRMELIDDSGIYPVSGRLPSRLTLPLRMFLALVAAVALAFGVDYLDSSIRTREEVETLVGPVLGEIPKR